MRNRLCIAAAALTVAAVFSVASALAADDIRPGAPGAAEAALLWLKNGQLASGAPPGFSTADGINAIVAGGQDPGSDAWRSSGGKTPMDALESEADSYDCEQRTDCNAGRAAKIVIAAVAAGKDPRNLAGNNAVAGIMADTADTGITVSNYSQAYALIALPAAGEPVPPAVFSRVLAAQRHDGGWGFIPGAGSDTNSTAIVVQGLVAGRAAAGIQQALIDAALARALDYLAARQNGDGGFGYDSSYRESEPDSTGGVILAIRAAGHDPKSGRWVKAHGPVPADPVGALMNFQRADGAFARNPGGQANAGSTVAAIPGVVERSLVCLVRLSACPPVHEAPGPPPDSSGEQPTTGTDHVAAGQQPPPAESSQPDAGLRQPPAPSLDPGPAPPTLVRDGPAPAVHNATASQAAPSGPDAGQPPMSLYPPGGGGFASPELVAAPSSAPPAVHEGQGSQPHPAAQPAYFAVAVLAAAALLAWSCGPRPAGRPQWAAAG